MRDNIFQFTYRGEVPLNAADNPCRALDDDGDCPVHLFAPIVRGLATGNVCEIRAAGPLSPLQPLSIVVPAATTSSAGECPPARCVDVFCTKCWSDAAVDQWSWRMPTEADDPVGWFEDTVSDLREDLEDLLDARLVENVTLRDSFRHDEFPVAPFDGTPSLCVEGQ